MEARFLFAFPPCALKVGNCRLSSAAIDTEFVDRIELLEVLFVAVDAAKFRISLPCRFPMASSACVAMADMEEIC